ncbi:MAG: hypothetical protein H0V65_08515 [Chitinophagales bacterium]|nr:hypothetical protein [Chitinophagales bacterium]
MKIVLLGLISFLLACNNNSSDNRSESSDGAMDVNEAVTDSTRILNDPVIVPDTDNQDIEHTKADTAQFD